jgi:hypothetical protein
VGPAEVDALHGVLFALYARSRLGGRCKPLDDLAHLCLEVLHLLDILVVDGGYEDQTWTV